MNPAPLDSIVLLLFALQGVWVLFMIVTTWSIRRVLKDIEDNTRVTNKLAEGMAAINVLLAGNFVTRPDYTRMEGRLKEVEQVAAVLRDRCDRCDRFPGRASP